MAAPSYADLDLMSAPGERHWAAARAWDRKERAKYVSFNARSKVRAPSLERPTTWRPTRLSCGHARRSARCSMRADQRIARVRERVQARTRGARPGPSSEVLTGPSVRPAWRRV